MWSSEIELVPESQSEVNLPTEDKLTFDPPRLRAVLADFGPLPQGTAFIGQTQLGQPLLFDLKDSTSGAILILGDPGCGKTSLLLTILESAHRLNRPDQISFTIIADQPYLFRELERATVSLEISRPYQVEARDRLRKLALLIEQRECGRLCGPIILFAVDGLPGLLDSLDDVSCYHLIKIIKAGPQVGVRPILTMPTPTLTAPSSTLSPILGNGFSQTQTAPPDLRTTCLSQWVVNEDISSNPFGTVIFGAMADLLVAKMLVGDDYSKIYSLSAGFEFYARNRGRMLRFIAASP